MGVGAEAREPVFLLYALIRSLCCRREESCVCANAASRQTRSGFQMLRCEISLTQLQNQVLRVREETGRERQTETESELINGLPADNGMCWMEREREAGRI